MKLLGALMLLFSGVGVASFLVKEAENALFRTRAWLELVRWIRSAVDNYSMSVSEMLSSCDRELLWRLGYPVNECIPESFFDIVEATDIPDRASREAVECFLADFGKNYREQQVSRCDECISVLRAREEMLAQQLPTKKKVILSVSLCATAAALILFL